MNVLYVLFFHHVCTFQYYLHFKKVLDYIILKKQQKKGNVFVLFLTKSKMKKIDISSTDVIQHPCLVGRIGTMEEPPVVHALFKDVFP